MLTKDLHTNHENGNGHYTEASTATHYAATQAELERRLRPSEETFRKMVNTVPSMIYQILFRPDGTIVYPFVSEGSKAIYGIEPERIMQDASLITRMWHPDDVGEYMRRVEECRRTLQPFDMECRIVMPDGQIKWLHVRSQPELQPDGGLLFYGVRIDITAQKEAEARLRLQQEQLNAAVDLAKLAFWEGDLQKQCFFFNEQCYALLGTSVAREGKYEISIEDYLSRFVLPEDVPASVQHLQAILASPTLNRGEATYRIRRADDGTIRYIKVIYHVERNADSVPVRLFGPMQDITDIKEAEEKLRKSEEIFRKTVNTVPSVIYQLKFNPDGTYSYPFMSENCKALYEVSAEEAMRDATILTKMWHPDDVEAYWRQIRRTLEHLVPLDITMRIITPSGKAKWVRVNSNPEKQADGSIVLYGVCTEITAQKQREQLVAKIQTVQQDISTRPEFYNGDFDSAVATLTEQLCDAISVGQAGVWFVDDEMTKIVSVDVFHQPTRTHSKGTELFAKDFPNYFAALRSERNIVATNAHRHPATAEFSDVYLTPQGIGAMLDVPIRYNGKVLGVICLEHLGGTREWTGEEINFALYVADMVSLAMQSRERKEAEAKLRQQQAQMNAAADLAQLAFWESDLRTQVSTLNDRCYALLGTSAEQEGGYQMSVQRFFERFVLPEDALETMQRFQAVLSSPTALRGDATYRIRRADNGRIRYIKVIYDIERDANGTPIRVFGPMQDITDIKETEEKLRKSEENFRKTVNAVPGMIYQFALLPDGTIQMPYVSEGCRDIFGLEPEAIMQNPSLLFAMMEPDDVATSQVAVAESAANMSPFLYETCFTLPTGKRIWTRFQGKPTKREDGAILWYGICVDITQLKTLEAELQARIKEIQETQAYLIQTEKMSSLGQMVAGIAHELNTPIGYASNNVALIRDRFKNISALLRKAIEAQDCVYNGQLEEAFTKMQEVSHSPNGTIAELDETIRRTDRLFNGVMLGFEQMANLVRSMRNFSRLDEAEMKKADINEGVRSCLLMIGHQLKDKNIELTTEYGDIPMVDCFPAQLNQVFLNLIQNAIHAVEERPEGKVHVSTGLEDGYVVVKVIDNGKGIPKPIQSKIFDPFFTTKPVGKGTGLGLSICYSIVQKHNGKLYFETEEGVGTTFFVKIPAVEFLETKS
ncbi:MAG: PAS domain-containing protein [Chloroherpetonaceae bacterium]|nr:PAS domain-containing protein [Chloroherpetonaceae bacterium]